MRSLVCFVSIVWFCWLVAGGGNPCVIPGEFSGELTEFIMNDGCVEETVQGYFSFSNSMQMAYINGTAAFSGQSSQLSIWVDYKSGILYLQEDGGCMVYPFKIPMVPSTILYNSSFLGEATVGSDIVSTWVLPQVKGFNGLTLFGVTSNCLPVSTTVLVQNNTGIYQVFVTESFYNVVPAVLVYVPPPANCKSGSLISPVEPRIARRMEMTFHKFRV